MKTFYINKIKCIIHTECFTLNKFETLNKFKTISLKKNCYIQKLHDLEKHIMWYMYFFFFIRAFDFGVIPLF